MRKNLRKQEASPEAIFAANVTAETLSPLSATEITQVYDTVYEKTDANTQRIIGNLAGQLLGMPNVGDKSMKQAIVYLTVFLATYQNMNDRSEVAFITNLLDVPGVEGAYRKFVRSRMRAQLEK